MMARVGEPWGGTWSSFNFNLCWVLVVAMSASIRPRRVTEIPDRQPARHLATAAHVFYCACGSSVVKQKQKKTIAGTSDSVR